jgi:hypothetical protein
MQFPYNIQQDKPIGCKACRRGHQPACSLLGRASNLLGSPLSNCRKTKERSGLKQLYPEQLKKMNCLHKGRILNLGTVSTVPDTALLDILNGYMAHNDSHSSNGLQCKPMSRHERRNTPADMYHLLVLLSSLHNLFHMDLHQKIAYIAQFHNSANHSHRENIVNLYSQNKNSRCGKIQEDMAKNRYTVNMWIHLTKNRLYI